MRVLIVEDEVNLALLIANRLKKEKYEVDTTEDGEDGLFYALTNIYDLIILDVMLPKMNGFQILREIKDKKINAKVIMLTAKDALNDKLEGFQDGAHDYITKPFHLEELVARVNVQMRGDITYKNKDILEYEDIELNIKMTKLRCTTTNETIEVVKKELLVLEYLIKNKEQIVPKEILYDKVWGMDSEAISNNLEAYISFIRRKIKSIGSKVNIKAIRGIGYKLEVTNE